MFSVGIKGNMKVEPNKNMKYWEAFNLGQQLERWTEKYSNNIALVEGDERLTYKELEIKSKEMAFGFCNLGIKKNDKVVIQLPNSINFVITCFALFKIGAVPILALPAHRERELNGIFDLSKPVAYIISESFLGFNYKDMAKELIKNHLSVKHLIIDGKCTDAISLENVKGKNIEFEEPSYNDTAVLLLSGGTTGIPKLIPRTHIHYVYNAKCCAERCKLREDSTYLAVLPVEHNFPLACPGIIGVLASGGKVVMCKTTSPDEAFPLIEKEKVTITALVPSLVSLWLEALEWDDSNDISSLEVLQVGGSVLDQNLARSIEPKMNCKLQQVFGIAEGLICCTSLDDPEEVIYTTQGKPISEYDEVLIVDEDGNDVPYGEYGELIVRGLYTIKGYYNLPSENKKAFTVDGFYCSGDKARFTKEGNIQIGGRIKEQINRAGEKVMPSEVESYLCNHRDIKEAAVVGVKDKELGEKICAYLISENTSLSLKDVNKFLGDIGVAHYKRPDEIKIIDFFPLTSVGKVDKKKLKQMAEVSF